MRIAPPDPFRVPGHGRSDTAVRLIALGVLVLGLVNLWSALLAHAPDRHRFLHETVHMPLVVQHASRTIVALFGLGLILLARSLQRHKRQAWWIAVFLAVTSPFPHLAKGLDYEEAIISLVFGLVLVVFRHAFYAENDRPSARQGILAALSLFGIAAVYGPVGYYLLRAKFKPTFTWDRAVKQTTHQVFFYPVVRALAPRRDTPRAYWFDNSLQTVAVLSLTYGMLMLLRPVLPRGRQSEQERARARRLLETFGGAPLAYFALLHDKRYLFDESGDQPGWGIAYVVVGRTAVALGDPFGDPDRIGRAIAAFHSTCRRHDWSPAFYQTTAVYLEQYRESRLRSLKVGEDALLDLPTWSMKGKAFQDLRTAINKMGRLGIVFAEFHADGGDADTLTRMDAISEEWLLSQKGEEKTFGLGRFDPESDLFRDSRLFVARDAETTRVLAFVSFVPIFGKGWALDLMRRGAETPNGLMEFLIASSILLFQSEGAALLSLGLSPLAGGAIPEPGETEIISRGRELLYQRFNLFYGFKGLHAFKEKFGPRWEARYLIYPGETALAQTVYGIIRAHSPRGLWTFIKR